MPCDTEFQKVEGYHYVKVNVLFAYRPRVKRCDNWVCNSFHIVTELNVVSV